MVDEAVERPKALAVVKGALRCAARVGPLTLVGNSVFVGTVDRQWKGERREREKVCVCGDSG